MNNSILDLVVAECRKNPNIGEHWISSRFNLKQNEAHSLLRRAKKAISEENMKPYITDWENTTVIPPEHRFRAENLYTYESVTAETVGNYEHNR